MGLTILLSKLDKIGKKANDSDNMDDSSAKDDILSKLLGKEENESESSEEETVMKAFAEALSNKDYKGMYEALEEGVRLCSPDTKKYDDGSEEMDSQHFDMPSMEDY